MEKDRTWSMKMLRCRMFTGTTLFIISRRKGKESQFGKHRIFRHSNKTMIYCGRLQSPMPALSA